MDLDQEAVLQHGPRGVPPNGPLRTPVPRALAHLVTQLQQGGDVERKEVVQASQHLMRVGGVRVITRTWVPLSSQCGTQAGEHTVPSQEHGREQLLHVEQASMAAWWGPSVVRWHRLQVHQDRQVDAIHHRHRVLVGVPDAVHQWNVRQVPSQVVAREPRGVQHPQDAVVDVDVHEQGQLPPRPTLHLAYAVQQSQEVHVRRHVLLRHRQGSPLEGPHVGALDVQGHPQPGGLDRGPVHSTHRRVQPGSRGDAQRQGALDVTQ